MTLLFYVIFMVLSVANRSLGSVGSGVGSPHVGPGYIWPMSLIVQAMTSRDDSEVRQLT
jgi:meiotically up-regulated gene 157 (Mug157) protein